jgi:uncharacterized surface protein with fasciclin (FAS1) repeats
MAKAVKFPNKANKSPKGPGGGKMGMMGNKAPKKMKAKKNKKNRKAKNSKKGGLVSGAPAPTPAPTRNPTRAPTRPPTTAPTSAAALVGAGGQTITGVVRSNPSTQTLLTLLERVGFASVLENPDQIRTLFAPNDDAFAALSTTDPILSELLTRDKFITHLKRFLLYHLSRGKMEASSIPNAKVITQLNLQPVVVLQEPFRINGIRILTPNNDAGTGIVHIIGEVLRPSWFEFTIINRVVADPELSILLELLALAELGAALNVPGEEFTLLAPTNTAFNNLDSGVLDSLRAEANRGALTRLLLYHVVDSIFTSSESTDGQNLLTIETGLVQVSRGPGFIGFNAAVAIRGEILANNGVVIKIDAVLDPVDGREAAP